MMGYVHIIVRVALLAVGAVMLFLGVAAGEAGQILRKAVIVCMECIGIG